MKNFEQVEGFTGDVKTSLKEYGLVCRREKGDQYHFIYSIPEGYEEAFIRESDINDLVLGKEYLGSEEINAFLQKNNHTITKFTEYPILYKVYSLSQYFGYETIMGKSIYPLTLNEVLTILEKE